MKAKYSCIGVVTVIVFVAIVLVWVRWTFWPPRGWLVPDSNVPMVLAALFTAAVAVGFGATIPKTRFWRRILQLVGGVLLIAFVVLPLNREWVNRAYYLFMPKPVVHQYLQGPVPGKSRVERLVTIECTPVIEKSVVSGEAFEMLVLRPAQGETVEVACESTFSPWYSTLPQGRKLSFTVWQTKIVLWHTDDGEETDTYWRSELETIRDGTDVLFDARVCPLHHVIMERVEVPICYGLPSKPFLEAFDQFSGGPGFVMGGCSVLPEKTEMAYRCPKCVEAYQAWEAGFREQFEKAQSGQSVGI